MPRNSALEDQRQSGSNREGLLTALAPKIDWPRALFRGRFMKVVARMERAGIPIDAELYAQLVERWDEIKLWMIGEVDKDYGVYEGATLKQAKLKAYAERQGIVWPRFVFFREPSLRFPAR